MKKILNSLKRKIASAKAEKRVKKHKLYNTMCRHSKEYKEAFEFSAYDIEILARSQTYKGTTRLSRIDKERLDAFEAGGEIFVYYFMYFDGCPYHSHWSWEILATCISNPSLNRKTGFDNARIVVIPEGNHEILLKRIKERPESFTSKR